MLHLSHDDDQTQIERLRNYANYMIYIYIFKI